ncbi:MAG: helix-turn-helix domain-containing protein [Gammaproteobacteria bacterium]|nr:helix-turn-helix domain-containing protein [Gammaproteobacteria bacterium]MBU1409046.1 helix-turn-helix domain-containing protein [Gammaproteobacteria bacterium]MBU1533533.1 helix-turn-helix domain-containing protein [Gammaproteobacteria bacterium]
MSIRVMTKVWDCPDVGGGSDLLALLALADWSDDEGRCWPSVAAVAKKIRLQPRQAQRVIHQLIEDGFVVVTGNSSGGAPGMTRQYRINLNRLTGVSGDTGVMGDGDGCHGRRETGVVGDTQTTIEPSIEPSVKQSPRADAQGNPLPDWLDADLWGGFIGHREELGKSLTPVGQMEALAELDRLRADGSDPDMVLYRAINSDRGILLPVVHHGHAGHL